MYLRGFRKNGTPHWCSEESWWHRKEIIKAAVKKSSEKRDADPVRKAAHRAKAAEGMKRRRQSDRLGMLMYQIKCRSKKLGYEFDLDHTKIYKPTHCPLLGIEIEYNAKGKAGGNSASLDRIDSRKGYTQDNVWIISWRANRIKSDATVEELELLTKNLKKEFKRRTRCEC